jgi:copper chaperone CopZ
VIKILKIDGMSCGHCENRVRNALSAVAGLKTIKVSASEDIAEIEVSDETMLKAAIDAIEDAGYDVIE